MSCVWCEVMMRRIRAWSGALKRGVVRGLKLAAMAVAGVAALLSLLFVLDAALLRDVKRERER